MGRYSSYGIVRSYAIPFEGIDSAIRRKLFGKSIEDYRDRLTEILGAQIPDVYEMETCSDGLLFRMKESVAMEEIVGLAKDFFNVSPYEATGRIPDDLSEFEGMTFTQGITKLCEEDSYVFQPFKLSCYYYAQRFIFDGHSIYIPVEVNGVMLYMSSAKTDAEDNIGGYDFMTDLLRYRLKENPLSGALLCFLSE